MARKEVSEKLLATKSCETDSVSGWVKWRTEAEVTLAAHNSFDFPVSLLRNRNYNRAAEGAEAIG